MKRTEIRALFASAPADGASVTVCGWAKTVRDSKNIGFIELSDGSCFKPLQVVFEAAKLENYKDIAKAGVGTSLVVTGRVVLTPGAKQPLEVNADSIRVLGACPPEYPLQKKRHTVEFLRTMPHLRPRTNTFSAAFRVRSVAAYGIHKFLQENGFAEDSIDGQLWFFKTEIESSERTAWNAIKDLPNTSDGAYEAGRLWCLKFERPRDGVGDSVERGNLAQNTYWPAYGGR